MQLAQRADISHSFLSQVERGLARPSMETLYRLAEALGTTSASLMGDEPDSQVVFHRALEGAALFNTAYGSVDGHSRHLLMGDSNSEVLEFIGAPAEFRDYWEHRGIELLYVVSGKVEVDLDGEFVMLGPGESISYDGSIPHRSRQVDGLVRMLLVCVDSRPDGRPGPQGTQRLPRSR